MHCPGYYGMPDIEFFYFCNIRQPDNVAVAQAVASIDS